MFLITVQTFDGATLKFRLKEKPIIDNGRVYFIDERQGVAKDFPSERVSIEEVKEND